MSEIPVIVVIDKSADFDKVKAACESKGLARISALPRMGMLKGMIDERRLDELTRIPGVSSVEKERQIQLPPRGSPVQ
jgi:endonuclease V-like protein UPF0215 family